MSQKYSIHTIVLTGLAIALIFIATLFIKIPNAIDGYFNLGDGFLLLFAMILPPGPAFLAGALGSALADLAGGYAYYFAATFIIKGLEAYIVSRSVQKFGSSAQFVSSLLASTVMVFGYFLFKWYLKGSLVIAVSGIPGNIVQAITGVVIALAAYPIVLRVSGKGHPISERKKTA